MSKQHPPQVYRNLLKAAFILTIVTIAGCATAKTSQPKNETYAFWPPYPNEPRLQFLTSFQSSVDLEAERSALDDLIYGKELHPVLPLNKPYGVEMYNGRIYICDIRNSSVTILDLRKRQTLIMGKAGIEPLQNPTDLAVAEDGMKYVSDLARGNIAVFDEKDRRVATFARPEFKPRSVAVFEDELFVCDFKSQAVQVINRKTGEFVRSIGGPGMGDGQFASPLGVAVDKQGDIYVMDVLRCKLQKFDRQGKYLMGFGTITDQVGGFVRPKHVEVDANGIIYVVDTAFQVVQLFNQIGQVLTFFGSTGPHPGAMMKPAGIALHDGDLDLFEKYLHPAFKAERLVLVTNQFGPNKVSVYAMGRLKPGQTVEAVAGTNKLVPSGVADETTTGKTRAIPADAEEPDLPSPFTPDSP